ncbi:MAG: MFS transporter [Acetobacteraceae bacterium]|nr:MFS transporter [Acetobacteraceae bacterium]
MRLFYGWIVVAVGMAVTCVGMGSMMSLGVFLQPISLDMGWSRTGISVAALVNFLAMGVGSFLWGTLSDRFGSRFVVLAGGVLLGAGLAAASQSTSLTMFQIVFGISIGLAAGSFYVPMTAMTVRWFTKNRSLAVALVSAGLGMGSTIMAPLARWIMFYHDWRFTMLVFSAIAFVVIVPLSLLLREPPVPAFAPVSQAGDPPLDMTLGQALRTPQFAAITLAFFACCAAHSGPIFHMVTYAIDCGVSDMAATTVFSVAGLSGLGGRIVLGLIADRVGAKHTLVAGLFVQSVAISLYLFTSSPASFFAAAMVFGFAYGGVMPLYAILVRENFPGRLMGSVFGVVAMVSTFGMAIGPVAGGWLFDTYGGYAWLYIGSVSVALSAAVIAWTLRPPRLVPRTPVLAGAAE